MTLEEALAASRVQAARGYDADNKCVVSVANYGGELLWLTGWGGSWAPEWVTIPEDGLGKLKPLDFKPTNPPPPVTDAETLKEIYPPDDEDSAEDSAIFGDGTD